MLYLKSNCDMENDVVQEKEILELDVKDCGAEQHSYQAYTKLSGDNTIRKPSHHGSEWPHIISASLKFYDI